MVKAPKELNREEVNAEEDALIDFQFALIDAMRERGITKADLATTLGVSRARISQLFSSSANPTLKLAGRALNALGLKSAYVRHEEVDAHSSLDKFVEAGSLEIAFDSVWYGEVALAARHREREEVGSTKWFARQHLNSRAVVWHQTDERVANSNSCHAMEAA